MIIKKIIWIGIRIKRYLKNNKQLYTYQKYIYVSIFTNNEVVFIFNCF